MSIDAKWCKRAIIDYVILMPEGFNIRKPEEVREWLDTMLANLIGLAIREATNEKRT